MSGNRVERADTGSGWMLRREVRLRKEFLLKKERELQSSETISKKRLLQDAIENGLISFSFSLFLSDTTQIARFPLRLEKMQGN